jgi:hypothetical protein
MNDLSSVVRYRVMVGEGPTSTSFVAANSKDVDADLPVGMTVKGIDYAA